MENRGALAELGMFVPPPRQPDFGKLSWDQVFEVLGHGLPADYIAFAEVYGTVNFNDELGVDDLRSRSPERLRQGRLYSNVLEFGSTGCGTHLAWLTEGHPDDWPVIDAEFDHWPVAGHESWSEPDQPLTKPEAWVHTPLTRFLLEVFTTEKFWLARPPTTFTNAELYQNAFPEGDPADTPFL